VREWCSFAEKRLEGSATKLIINTGNDDPFSVDSELQKCKRITFPEGKAVDIGNSVTVLSLGYSNNTPWGCPRELSEEDLRSRISQMISLLPKQCDFRRVIFNFHCPPFGTELDQTIKIDSATLKPVIGAWGTMMAHVGSTAVREAIERWKP